MRPLATAFADFLDRFDLCGRQAEPLELVGACGAYDVVMKRIECCKQPVANCRGCRDRKLLPAYDGAQAGIAGLAPAQTEGAGFLGDGHEPRVGKNQLGKSGLQIGLGVKEVGHAILSIGDP